MFKTSRRFDTGCIIKIFDTDRNPMKRAAPLASPYLCLGDLGLLTGLISQNSDKRIELRVEIFKSFETFVYNYHWRNVFRLNEPGYFLECGMFK
jgi:hypothetical protein